MQRHHNRTLSTSMQEQELFAPAYMAAAAAAAAEKRQAALLIQSTHRVVARRWKANRACAQALREERPLVQVGASGFAKSGSACDASSLAEEAGMSVTTAGGYSERELAASKLPQHRGQKARGQVDMRKQIRTRDTKDMAAAAHAEAQKAQTPELRAAELIQARWRYIRFRLGKLKSAEPKKGTRKAPKSQAGMERDRAAARLQAQQRARKARQEARTGKSSYARSLESTASRKANLDQAIAAASAIVGRFTMGVCRKRRSRKGVQQETKRRQEAATKLQAARRSMRTRNYVGYRGSTEREYGRPDGPGRMVWPDTSYYHGEWALGLMSGHGDMVWHDGTTYCGEWRCGARHGRGVYQNRAGDVHDGSWWDGVPHGAGRLTLLNGSVTDGMWVDGSLEGHASEEMRNEHGCQWDSSFEGEFLLGERHGPGKEASKLGTYEGMWKHGRRNGVGKLVTSYGWTYRGHWKNGVRVGQGMYNRRTTMTLVFGPQSIAHGPNSIARGTLIHSRRAGVFSSTMGHRFSGAWKDDHLPTGSLTGRFLGQYEGRFKATGCADSRPICARPRSARPRSPEFNRRSSLLAWIDCQSGRSCATVMASGRGYAATSTTASGRTTTTTAMDR